MFHRVLDATPQGRVSLLLFLRNYRGAVWVHRGMDYGSGAYHRGGHSSQGVEPVPGSHLQ